MSIKGYKRLFGILSVIFFILAFIFLGSENEYARYFGGYSFILIGEVLLILVGTIEGIISRIEYKKEEKEYRDNNPFKCIDDYNHTTHATFADKIMYINDNYDKLCFELIDKGTTERGNVLFQNEDIKLVAKKLDGKVKVKAIDNSKAQTLGRRRLHLEHEKNRINYFDEFGKQIILVAFIRIVYDSASASFIDDKGYAATAGAIVTIITYLIYFLFLRGLKKPNEIYYLNDYEIKKIDALMVDVDTPIDWDEKKKQQYSNRKTKHKNN